jgi:hypothetical protein
MHVVLWVYWNACELECRWRKTGERLGDDNKLAGVQCLRAKGWKAHETRESERERENFELVDLDAEWRYLGVIQNGHGDVDNMVKCLNEDEIWNTLRKYQDVKILVLLVPCIL